MVFFRPGPKIHSLIFYVFGAYWGVFGLGDQASGQKKLSNEELNRFLITEARDPNKPLENVKLETKFSEISETV